MKENQRNRGSAIRVLIATSLYGLGNTTTKLLYRLYPDVQPADAACIRFILTTLLLVLVCAVNKNYSFRVKRKDIPMFLLMGLGLSVCVFCILSAVNYINVGAASFIQSTNTLFLCIISFVFLKERISIKKSIGIIVGFVGLTVMFYSPDMFQMKSAAIVGYMVALLSAVGKSTYILTCKKLRQEYEAIPVVMYCTMIASVVMLCFSKPWQVYAQYGQEAGLHILMVVTGLICSGLAYILYFTALKTVEASTAGVLNTVEPVSSTLTALIILNEVFTVRQGIGCLLILAGVLVTQINFEMRKNKQQKCV